MQLDLERLKKVAYIATNATEEKDITYFAFGLLNCAGIGLNNSYTICSKGNMIEIRLSDIKLLVIRCEISKYNFDEIKHEFMDYMKSYEFRHGMIIRTFHSYFYSQNNKIVKAEVTLNNVLECQNILNIFIDMRIPDYENI